MMPEMTPDRIEDFLSRILILTDDDCWPWQSRRFSATQRGLYKYHQRSLLAHRITWELQNGAIPDGMKVCHHCDNGLCCNPAHLFLGTQQDNIADMIQKGRHWNMKLCAEQVLEIRRLASEGNSARSIARQFGLDKSSVQFIVTRRTWKHI